MSSIWSRLNTEPHGFEGLFITIAAVDSSICASRSFRSISQPSSGWNERLILIGCIREWHSPSPSSLHPLSLITYKVSRKIACFFYRFFDDLRFFGVSNFTVIRIFRSILAIFFYKFHVNQNLIFFGKIILC